MERELIVKTEKLGKVFDGKTVIRDCTMSVEKGTIYGFLGRNGAGKTTVLKLLLRLLQPTFGEGRVFGMDIAADRRKILRQTGSLIEAPVFYEHLSAKENLQFHLAYMGYPDGDIEKALRKVKLSGIGMQPVSTYSLGMRQRLAIARAMVHDPQLLILDEPVNGLDPVGVREIRELFHCFTKEEGKTILLSSHILSEVEQTADRIGVIVNGTVVEQTTPEIIHSRYPSGIEDYFIATTEGGANT